MKRIEISCEEMCQVVQFRIYANAASLRRGKERVSVKYVGEVKGRFRNKNTAVGGCIGFGAFRNGSEKEWLVQIIFLHRNQHLPGLMDHAAHECTHAAEHMVDDGEREGQLRLLARDSETKKDRKRSEAMATISGSLLSQFYQWAVDHKFDSCAFAEDENGYNPTIWPGDLWRW